MREKRYSGYVPNPEVYSSQEGGLVPTGVALYQCEFCGCWLTDKMAFEDELEHDRVCSSPFVSHGTCPKLRGT